jgi:DNA-binding XRE family transcriptional regulator
MGKTALMANREQRLARASWIVGRDLDELAAELRQARRQAGLTQVRVAAALGVSHQTIHRHERGYRGMRIDVVARHAAAVGLRLRIRAYPEGPPLRDAGQIELIRRFRAQLGEVGAWAFEVPIPRPGDPRAFDAVLRLPEGQVALEFITRLADAQAQLRAVRLKQRDAGIDRLLVIVQRTRANQRALGQAGSVLLEFPAKARHLLAQLAAGEMPSSDGVIPF